eukprot:jgi/Bigna1/91768/estExt_fgenesh1_pg.C_1180003
MKNEDFEHSSSSFKLLGKRNRSDQDALSLDQQKQKLLQTKVVGGDPIVVIKGLNPDDYKDVRNNNTYLWINGEHRIKDIVRVCKSKNAAKYDYDGTVELHGDTDEKLTVRFLRSDNGKVQRITHKRKESATINLSGEIILKSNFPIEKLELLDEDMKPIKNKKYKWLLYDEPHQQPHQFDAALIAKYKSSSQLAKKPKLSPKSSPKVKSPSTKYVRKTKKRRLGDVDSSPMETETIQENIVRVKKEPGT